MRYLKLFFIPIVCILIGCATYGSKVEKAQIQFSQGKYESALKSLEKAKSDRSKLLYLMEKGTLLHYAGKYDESNKAFDEAEILAEELYTKSISREAGAFITSDNILPYVGEKFERALIHYYRAFNYIYLGLPDDALVECRKVSFLLQRYSDQSENKSTSYSDDAFIQYIAGILFESRGELNEAFVSYRKAEEAYAKYEKEYGVSQPSSLKIDLLKTAKSLGFTEEYDFYKEKYKINDDQLVECDDAGELIFIHENGFAPKKTAEELVLPILKTDNIDDTDVVRYSGDLRKRAGRQYAEVEIAYLLRVSIPSYESNRPRISYIKAETNGIQILPEMAEDVEAIAFKTFDERLPRIILKTIARGVTKYLAFRTAQKKKGETAGLLVNIFNVVTESADTRSWLTLPNNFHMIRTSMPPGTYKFNLNFYSKNGHKIGSAELPNVEIKKDDFTFINYRTFN